MKKILLILITALLLYGCSNNENIEIESKPSESGHPVDDTEETTDTAYIDTDGTYDIIEETKPTELTDTESVEITESEAETGIETESVYETETVLTESLYEESEADTVTVSEDTETVLETEVFVPEVNSVIVPILMFHDIKAEPGGTWSMGVENFRATLEHILARGFTPVSFRQLVGYVDGYAELPEKPVCITFDDGYYSNYEFVLPIVVELEVPVTVFVICDAVRDGNVIPDGSADMLYNMSHREMAEMEASRFVDLQSHSYGLHGENYTYGDSVRNSVLPLYGEGEAEYKAVFNKDCEAAEATLLSCGVWSDVVFSYPNGLSHPWTESVLKERGYRASVTTDFDRLNLVEQGNTESLFLLGRMNVNDDTPLWELDSYLDRK